MIIHGDSIEKLKELEPNSIEALVTDPPYGLGDTSPTAVAECLNSWLSGSTYNPKGSGFMNKAWDKWVPDPALWREVYRVLKPGAHGLVFSGSRTEDLMSISLRLSGFEVRDRLVWLYSSGFPKSHNVALSIDKHHGHPNRGRAIPTASRYQASDVEQLNKLTSNKIDKYEPREAESEKWQGWGTALKPAYEPIILIRKPLLGTVAQNTLSHGCGAINIDSCRIDTEDDLGRLNKIDGGIFAVGNGASSAYLRKQAGLDQLGRWPANIILDEVSADMLGGASRYFYTTKANKKEREAGLDYPTNHSMRANHHPTVKPIDLMRYLCRLITPLDGTVLDPFAGSGTTLCAAALEGFNVLGVERELEYVRIAEARLAHWSGGAYEPSTPTDTKPTIKTGDQLNLF
ncbi:MAG: DNA-methyltransferase [Ilumatobacteraceae bacterium]